MGIISFISTFLSSVGLILLTEFGDKTFFVAAILATKYNYLLVYSACWSALALMTIISGLIGLLIPTLLNVLPMFPKPLVSVLSATMLVAFGVQMLYEGVLPMIKEKGITKGSRLNEPGEDELEGEESEERKAGKTDVNEEMEEAQKEIEETVFYVDVKDSAKKSRQEEAAKQVLLYASSVSKMLIKNGFSTSFLKQLSDFNSQSDNEEMLPVSVGDLILFFEIFSMNLLAEWGDKSQITTVALSSSTPSLLSTLGVLLGGICGHALCTGIAVSFGYVVAEQIPQTHLNIAGGSLFLLFAAQILVTW